MEINDDIDMEIFVNGLSGIELPWNWKYQVLLSRDTGVWLGWQYAHYFGPKFPEQYEKFLEQENAK